MAERVRARCPTCGQFLSAGPTGPTDRTKANARAAVNMRIDKKTYAQIAIALGGFSRERARQLVFLGAEILNISKSTIPRSVGITPEGREQNRLAIEAFHARRRAAAKRLREG